MISRNRTQGSFKGAGLAGYWNPDTNQYVYGNQTTVGSVKTMQDIVTKDFRKRSSKGEVIMNPMSKSEVTITAGTLSGASVYTKPYTTKIYWDFGVRSVDYLQLSSYWGGSVRPGPGELTQMDKDQLVGEVSTRVLSQRQRSNTDMWENLAEAGKTLQMIQNPVNSWFVFHRKMKAIAAAASAANAWLMYRYGITPLISSVDGLLTEYYKSVRPLRVTTRARGEISADSASSVTFASGNDRLTYGIQKTTKYSIRAMSLDTAVNSGYHRYGFGGKSLLTLPWELVPYSFVVDWCFNVGDYLGSIADAFTPKTLGQCLVDEWEMTEKRTGTSHTNVNSNVVILSPGLYWAHHKSTLGGRFPGALKAELVIKNDFKLTSALRLADSFSLIGQQILGLFMGKK